MAALEQHRLFLVRPLLTQAAVAEVDQKTLAAGTARAAQVAVVTEAEMRQTTLALLVPLTQAAVVAEQLVAAAPVDGQAQAAPEAPAL